MFMFVGTTGGKGELRISDHGSVNLVGGDLIPNVNTNLPSRSALIHIIGSNATLNAQNDQSMNMPTEVHNQYLFQADSGGISTIKLVDAVNIDNNDLTVDLTGFAMTPHTTLTLFDAAPNRIFGQFANVTITGTTVPNLHVSYNQALGDIQIVPEPASVVLMCMGALVIGAVVTRRAK
jgi:hypothetical protein